MSSSISSSDTARRFVIRLLLWVMLSLAGLFALGIYLEPLDGDLTRTGFYSERDYGWRGVQEIFPQTQLAFPASRAETGRYDGYYDVVVLGDSFSYSRPKSQWQNYLAAETGLSVATLYIGQIGLSQLLASRPFREHPPKVLIVESVERRLPAHLKEEVPDCSKASLSRDALKKSPAHGEVSNHGDFIQNNQMVADYALRYLRANGINQRFPSRMNSGNTAFVSSTQAVKPLPGMVQQAGRDTSWQQVKLAYVRSFLWNNLLRRFAGREATDTVRLELARPAPFSSRERDSMLVYLDDIEKARWWKEAGLEEMNCRINAMRQQVEANGYTRFVLMVPPDKLTAYADFLQDRSLKDISLLPALSALQPQVMPRIDLALDEAIRQGVQDVYLPDNTHWGSNGQRAAAAALKLCGDCKPAGQDHISR